MPDAPTAGHRNFGGPICLLGGLLAALLIACQAAPAPPPDPAPALPTPPVVVASATSQPAPEMTPPPVALKVQPEFAKGDPNAPVTLYDFSDFR